MKFTKKFQHLRDTKGTIVFQELDESGSLIASNRDGAIGALYIQKSMIGHNIPETITVTVEDGRG